MGKVAFVISVSRDGYIAGPNRTAENPTGDGGDELNAWMNTPSGQEYLANNALSLGAVIAGRVTMETSLPWWKENGPTGDLRIPVVVLTNDLTSRDHDVYHFVRDPASALIKARLIAGDKDICVMGGAETGRAMMSAGFVDTVVLHETDVMLNDGIKLFPSGRPMGEPIDVQEGEGVLHKTYSLL
jgi:dihydrofolate reductase